MTAVQKIGRFALYGEQDRQMAPEFVHIEAISERSRTYDWTIRPHSHPGIFQILLLEAGRGTLATESLEADLAPGTLVVLPAGCVHAFRFAAESEGWVLSIAVDLLDDPRIAALCTRARQPEAQPWWLQMAPGEPRRRMAWLLGDLAGMLAHDRAGLLTDAAAALIALIVSLALEQLSATSPAQPAKPQAVLARRFRALVELHFREDWSVAHYARVLGATTPTLTRNCRAVFGKAPKDLVLDRILLEAMRDLTYSTAQIGQIAADLGFADIAYFSRFFRKRTGVPPSTFREERLWLVR